MRRGPNWGLPARRKTLTTAAIVREQWFYGAGRVLHFERGRLVAIEE